MSTSLPKYIKFRGAAYVRANSPDDVQQAAKDVLAIMDAIDAKQRSYGSFPHAGLEADAYEAQQHYNDLKKGHLTDKAQKFIQWGKSAFNL